MALALCGGAAALVRWRLADLGDWGIDQSANLWLGTLLRDGGGIGVGLVSSTGTPNLAGAPLLAAPLSLLPDLLAVSRALALAQLLALAALARAVAGGGRGGAVALAALAFCPAALLAAPTLWNQYLALPLTAVLAALLLRLAEGGGGFVAATLLVTLLLLQPAVHLAGFADLAAEGALALALLGLAAAPTRPAAVELAVAIGFCALLPLYQPWLARLLPWSPAAAAPAYAVVAIAAVIAARGVAGRLRFLVGRAADLPALSWTVPAMLAAGAASAVVTFWGTPAARLARAGDGWGVALLAAQVAVATLALPALPGLLAACRAGATPRTLLRAWWPGRERGAALLLANAALLLAVRVALVPAALRPGGRADLLLPLLPALLAPALLLVVVAPRPGLRAWATAGAGGAAVVVCALALLRPGPGLYRAHPRFLPPSELRAVVDWIAAQPGARDADGRLDVGYDLEQGRAELVRIACSPWTSWYTVSRPFDWLFRRRHGLRDVREGRCARAGGGRWLVTYREAPPPAGRQRRLALAHLVVWE